MGNSEQGNPVIGSVMVVGGGISGMQSALDLAESGFKVYLLEEKPAIGGVMSRLDKTFPTNDCAMCIVSPRLVAVGRHLNIEIITGAKVKGITGEPGNFQVRVHKKARIVNSEKCTGCGDCERVCPVELKSEFNEGLSKRKAIYKLYPQAVPASYAIEKRGVAPCRAACPAGVNVQGYVQLIKAGKFREAWILIYRDNPFPAVCGRVCTHPCQDACHRAKIDDPMNIRHLKRFTTKLAYASPDDLPLPEVAPLKEERVAVIGSGPAGLSAAYQLVKKGYQVTVFEAAPVPGGMMRVAIPEYRLPKALVDFEIKLLEKFGVQIKTNTAIGPDLTFQDLIDQGYRAVFLSVGARCSTQLRVKGEELPGVHHALEFLRQVNLGQKVEIGRRVAVIGGGNSAMDAARTAMRLGADDVTVIYRRTFEEITAHSEEIAEAEEEGVKFSMLVAPVAFHSENGRLSRIECIRNELGESDEGGRRKPVPVPGSEFFVDVDNVIIAVGQNIDLSFLENLPLAKGRRGRLNADPETMATDMPGVFGGGDALTGPATIIEAIAAGKRAAGSIDRYLQGQDLRVGREFHVPEDKTAPPDPDALKLPPRGEVPLRHLDPAERVNSFDQVTIGYEAAEALEEASRCLNCGECSECMECVKACLPKAVDHTMTDEELELQVGAVVLSPGFETFDAGQLDMYGYGKYPNVVTSIQFERILSASGPFQGHLIRPFDGREPKKIAWIQCVGSRNIRIGRGYCSAVCCMYAIKEAVIAKEHSTEPLDTAIFFMDMRTYGKDFEKYYERGRKEHGVRFIRSRVFELEETSDDRRDLVTRYAGDDGAIYTEIFDLIVLSVGLKTSECVKEMASNIGVELDEYGFCKTGEFTPGFTSRPGVFVSGPFCEPKDIPETVVEASAAASHASCLLSPARGTMTRVKEYPPERPVGKEKPRVGVFVCNCGINIGSVVRVSEVVKYAITIKGVVHAEEFLFTCSQDSIERIKNAIVEHRLNRVVVASCTPRTHAPLFQSALREAGLNSQLYEHVNIREHSSWVHRERPLEATVKAKDLVTMAISKVKLLKPVVSSFIEIDKRVLVVGGGASGMATAASLAEQGFEVYLVEKSQELGGNLKKLRYALEGSDPGTLLKELTGRVEAAPGIEVLTEAEVVETGGYPGNYQTTVNVKGKNRTLTHGALVMATGAKEYRPNEYLYGNHPGVVTQSELEERLAQEPLTGQKTVVMIQCVGSRDESRPYCSRICCQKAVKNALKIKEQSPEAQIFIIYRDVRMYGLKERYYTEARQKGIIFIRYEPEERPEVKVEPDGHLSVTVRDPILDRSLIIDADLVALSAGIVPNEDNEKLSRLFKVPLNADGFFLEAHMKLRPVDFSAEGMYLCGLAHSPKLVGESLVQAGAAAMRAVSFLAAGRRETLPIIATVNEWWCTGCGQCVKVCSFGARYIESGVARVQEVLCQGCGACVATCPSGATHQNGFDKPQILAALQEF